jgi:hypothetical protein
MGISRGGVVQVRSALRHLEKSGAEALLPRKQPDSKNWYKPRISKRVAADLRKKAIREGTFGSFDSTTYTGWDPKWDVMNVGGGGINWMQIRRPKETKRERIREARAVKIENLLAQADQKIADYKIERKEKKPEPGIVNTIKKMMKSKGQK